MMHLSASSSSRNFPSSSLTDSGHDDPASDAGSIQLSEISRPEAVYKKPRFREAFERLQQQRPATQVPHISIRKRYELRAVADIVQLPPELPSTNDPTGLRLTEPPLPELSSTGPPTEPPRARWKFPHWPRKSGSADGSTQSNERSVLLPDPSVPG